MSMRRERQAPSPLSMRCKPAFVRSASIRQQARPTMRTNWIFPACASGPSGRFPAWFSMSSGRPKSTSGVFCTERATLPPGCQSRMGTDGWPKSLSPLSGQRRQQTWLSAVPSTPAPGLRRPPATSASQQTCFPAGRGARSFDAQRCGDECNHDRGGTGQPNLSVSSHGQEAHGDRRNSTGRKGCNRPRTGDKTSMINGTGAGGCSDRRGFRSRAQGLNRIAGAAL